jgi:hypothetical protein
MRRALVLALAIVSAGCVQISTMRVGERFAPKPEDCQLEYQYGDMMKVASMNDSYAQVGHITVVKGGDDFSEDMKRRVRPYACNMGGDLVMMGGSSPGSFTTSYSYASLIVLRKRSAQ